jgi:hypothetical protein
MFSPSLACVVVAYALGQIGDQSGPSHLFDGAWRAMTLISCRGWKQIS